MTDNLWILFAAAGVMAAVIVTLSLLGDHYTLNNIKSKTVGDGQHGTARWATDTEIRKTYALVPFQVSDWRAGKNLPGAQGLVLGSTSGKHGITALVDKDDVHCLMIGASGVGKTAYFLYPNLEYACASGMSFFATDTKGDLARNYGAVAARYYGYHVSVVDLRNPTRSDGYNLLTLINRYMDTSFHEHSIEAYGKAENLASILAHSIIAPKGDEDRGQNDYFYKAAEGVVASVILLLAEFLPPDSKHPTERRHLVSVFILIQQLLAPSGVRGKIYFKQLMDMLPPHHRARNLASSALESSDQATASAMSTALAQMNTFMDIALEQVICFDSNVDAKKFAKEKTAIFLVLPEEDRTKNFMAGLMILMAGAVWQIGDIVVEYIAERRKHKCDVPQLLRDVHTAGADGLADLIENSGLLRRQKKALLELAESRGLPKDTLTALAERLLATEEARNARTTSVTDMIAKLGPMFGLLGTLIPLGPGIVALGQGDTVTLSESMNVAFDTTIAGVISAAVASVISHIRKRWYNDDMVSLETLMEAVLEEVTADVEG